MPSGLEILQETIEICKVVGDSLDSGDGVSKEWEPALVEIADRLSGLTPSFFFKTMPSVPASRACQREAAALKELCERRDWSDFPQGVEKLQKSVRALADKATMKGVTLT